MLALLVAVVLGVTEAGCGWGFPVNVLRVLAGGSLGVRLAWPIPRWILDDGTQLNLATPGSKLLSPRSTLSPVTFMIGDPPGDHP